MAAVNWGLQVTGTKQLKRALKVLGETDAPFLREALDDGGRILEREASPRAPGGIAKKVAFTGTKGTGANVRALVTVSHPGAKAMEFGRTKYYRGYTGRGKGVMKRSGQKFKANPGQPARPFMGIKQGDQAIGAAKPRVERLLADAIQRTWDSIGREG